MKISCIMDEAFSVRVSLERARRFCLERDARAVRSIFSKLRRIIFARLRNAQFRGSVEWAASALPSGLTAVVVQKRGGSRIGRAEE